MAFSVKSHKTSGFHDTVEIGIPRRGKYQKLSSRWIKQDEHGILRKTEPQIRGKGDNYRKKIKTGSQISDLSMTRSHKPNPHINCIAKKYIIE